MNYGKASRIARAIAGLEQRQLAKAAGLDPSYISLIEKGARQPSLSAISKICRALRMPEPLFTMLATEAPDVRGLGNREFEKIATHVAKFLVNYESVPKQPRRKRSDSP